MVEMMADGMVAWRVESMEWRVELKVDYMVVLKAATRVA